uniref:Uncharacterized protein n=1 Tax=Anopheles braziliensis TaxID=58242 RepID=A0A2M3Z0R0_9DIPT
MRVVQRPSLSRAASVPASVPLPSCAIVVASAIYYAVVTILLHLFTVLPLVIADLNYTLLAAATVRAVLGP